MRTFFQFLYFLTGAERIKPRQELLQQGRLRLRRQQLRQLQLRLWQQLASTNAVADAYTMFEYLNFVCRWQTYTAKFAEGEDYLYPSDALRFIETEGAQYNYGFKDGYFDSLKNTVLSVNETAFAELVGIISDASELADYAYSELKAEKYHTVKKYSETFKEDRLQYEMNNQAELNERIDSLYERFSLWIASWEI
jgi:hypothetical protein